MYINREGNLNLEITSGAICTLVPALVIDIDLLFSTIEDNDDFWNFTATRWCGSDYHLVKKLASAYVNKVCNKTKQSEYEEEKFSDSVNFAIAEAAND
ncbi:hypothetical protein [Colwellia sp. BRX8-9]|uniref:hypothetical protein n=1 Tax=Colwellia sp. BRX8-9 TaxID=2759831 RepID=UPI0015F5C787|nr:hypothetical protein [Colwellia sp. BRX8-9]MBA6349859.1 hypothetical protein [Colwellia sp. BRX8-9]